MLAISVALFFTEFRVVDEFFMLFWVSCVIWINLSIEILLRVEIPLISSIIKRAFSTNKLTPRPTCEISSLRSPTSILILKSLSPWLKALILKTSSSMRFTILNLAYMSVKTTNAIVAVSIQRNNFVVFSLKTLFTPSLIALFSVLMSV
ncbi:hypothetical protein HP9810_882g1 [Helicobacter pylori 98-10]|nr:hypothetical protein HP9810_882g1 [Helicobacter pylori 98-10]